MLITGIYYSDWKRRKLSRMRIEEGIDLAGGGAATEAAPVDTQTTIPDETAHADGATPVVDDAEAMWGNLTDEPPAAAAETVIPPEFSKVFGLSEYVKEPAHVESAVRTAAEVWDVVSGKSKASGLLEAMRAQNPAQYEKTVLEDIVPYIEKITGKKFGAVSDTAPDPVAEMRAEIERLKDAPVREAQQRQQEQQIQRAHQVTAQHLEGLVKSGNGIFDSNVNGAMDSIAAQLPKLGITSDDLMKQVLAGNMTTLEKAYKAAEKAKTLEVKAYADAVKKRYTTLKGAIPASRGGSATATAAPTDGHDMTTQSGRAKWMAEQFKAGN